MIDSHCHLDFDKFDSCRDEAVNDAIASGVNTIVNIGVDLRTSQRSIELAHKYPSIYATVGVHPHDAKTLDDTVIDKFRELAKDSKVVAIGEIGLDYYRDLSPRPLQQTAFRKQLELAIETKLPVVIHTREAFEDTVAIVSEYASDLVGGVFHCFPGSVDDALEVITLGFVVSVGGVITFPKATMSEIAIHIPLESLILETDSPYLTPVPHRGKQNYPAYVRFVYEKVAELRGMSLSAVEKKVDRTCRKMYRLEEMFEG